jgi:hypothetical protein
LAVGTHAITAAYRGDDTFLGSDTNVSPLTQTVTKRTGRKPSK